MYRSSRVLRPCISTLRGSEISQASAGLVTPISIGTRAPGLKQTTWEESLPLPTPIQSTQPKAHALDLGLTKHLDHPLEVAYFNLNQTTGQLRFDQKQMFGVQKLARIFDKVVANPEWT